MIILRQLELLFTSKAKKVAENVTDDLNYEGVIKSAFGK